MIAIIDYGAGNLHSVKNALDFLNAESIVTGDSETILNADKVILPGVGAFGDAMKCLEKSGLVETVKAVAKSGKPLLGICLGLHLMFFNILLFLLTVMLFQPICGILSPSFSGIFTILPLNIPRPFTPGVS